jgi:hypothetical protein
LISKTSFLGHFGRFWPFLGPKKWIQFFLANFLAKNRLGPYSREGLGLVMQKTEVFDIITIFWGPLWPILADFDHFWALKSRVNFFGLIFWPKTDWGHTLGKVWG